MEPKLTDTTQIEAAPSTPAVETTPNLSAELSRGISAAESAEQSAQTGSETTQTPSTPAATPAQQQAFSVREHLKAQGIDPSSFQDDASALTALLQGYQQQQQRVQELQQLAQYGQQVLPHLGEFQKWQASQQEAAKQAPVKEPWYKPPEYDPKWLSQLAVDDKGNVVPKPGTGATIETVQKYLKWQEHQQNFQESFVKDPIGTLKPGLEELIEAKVQERIKQDLGGYQDQVFATQMIAQESTWLHNRDASGRVIGLSPAGQSFAQKVQMLEQQGIKNVRQQYEIAKNLVEADLLRQNFMLQQNKQTNLQQKQAVVQQTSGVNRIANLQGSLPAGNLNGTEPSQNADMNLVNRLRMDLNQNGVTDSDLLQNLLG